MPRTKTLHWDDVTGDKPVTVTVASRDYHVTHDGHSWIVSDAQWQIRFTVVKYEHTYTAFCELGPQGSSVRRTCGDPPHG